MVERRSKITVSLVRENPPRGKFIRKVVVKEEKDVLDSYEAARLLGITRRHLYNLMKGGTMPYRTKMGRHLFRVLDLHRWMVKTGRDNLLPLSSSGKKEVWFDK